MDEGAERTGAGGDPPRPPNAPPPRADLFHVIYLRCDALLISRKPYAGWREIQDEWDDYMTSLGPWTVEDVVDFFQQQYGPDERRWPFGTAEVEAFAVSDREVMRTAEG